MATEFEMVRNHFAVTDDDGSYAFTGLPRETTGYAKFIKQDGSLPVTPNEIVYAGGAEVADFGNRQIVGNYLQETDTFVTEMREGIVFEVRAALEFGSAELEFDTTRPSRNECARAFIYFAETARHG